MRELNGKARDGLGATKGGRSSLVAGGGVTDPMYGEKEDNVDPGDPMEWNGDGLESTLGALRINTLDADGPIFDLDPDDAERRRDRDGTGS